MFVASTLKLDVCHVSVVVSSSMIDVERIVRIANNCASPRG